MAVQFKDYYEVLGVDRDADDQQIKKAFKKLARKHHPDVAEDKNAAEIKFKEINEAYEVLGDPEKRSKYDVLGENWQHGADFTPPPGSGGFGFDPEGGQYEYHFGGSTGFSDFFENLFGGRSAGDPFGAFGGGYSGQRSSMRGQDIESDLLVSVSEIINGGERVIQLQGRDPKSIQTIKIKIPKGISENQLIRCAAMGNPGFNGGENGDLFLRVKYQRHPDFRFEGNDVHYELEIPVWECVLGTEKEISTPHGKVKMKIPAAIQAGTRLRISNQGLPNQSDQRGDFYVEVHPLIPKELNAEQRKHWQTLADSHQT